MQGSYPESTSRLCDLISVHLIPYLEPKLARLTKETERDVLLSLTMVRREIQQWMTKSNREPENLWQMSGGSCLNHCCHEPLQQKFVGVHRCLCNIVCAMVVFLNADSQFVRHAAGNILLSISHFFIKNECLWVQLIQLIWFILEDTMSELFSYPKLPAPDVIHVNDSLLLHEQTLGDITEVQNLQSARFPGLHKSRLLNVNQFIVLNLFQTLRKILKSLNHDSDDLEIVFIQYAISSLIKMPWELLIETFKFYYTSQIHFRQVDESDSISSHTGIKDLLLGTILQFCCSIVDEHGFEANGTNPFKELPVFLKFSDLLPKLLSCCFVNHSGNSKGFLFEYLRHKSLIVMIRLSFHSHWKNSHPESWLKLLNQFFGEILYRPFSGCDTGSENCLGESPFSASSLEGNKSYARHLQRQAIFLLFKCSFTIACVGEACQECSCKEETIPSDLQLRRRHCCLDLLEIFTWLQSCCPLDKFQNCRNYSESCSSFATSFLQLYMEEDNMLLKMLLQLLDSPFSSWQKEQCDKNGSIGANKDILCHFSSIFCPIRLFHLFLLRLHYDHLVLVDSLISKDTGLLCLQYLLRILRLIYNSWPAFIHFFIFGNKSDYLYQKRRKISSDGDMSPTVLSSTTAFRRQILRPHNNFQCAYEISDSHAFKKSKGCLHSLKISLEGLQRKCLFPYNPKPLIKSLDRFLELCMAYNSQQM